MPPPPAPNRKRVDRFAWNRHYFRDRTPLGRARRWLVAIALVATTAWAVFAFAIPKEAAHYPVSHGPVASPHAAWDQRCDACHAAHSMSELSSASLLDVHNRWNDFHCEICHAGPVERVKDYAPHHISAIWTRESQTMACSACHHDHQGRDFSLVKVPDADCVQCHQDPKNHHDDHQGKLRFDEPVTGFPSIHPPFKGVKGEFKRTLRFNHSHHMMAGVPPTPEATANRTNGEFKIGDIPAAFRDRYRQPGQADGDAVQLSCTSCHQLDAGRLTASELARRPDGEKFWRATENLLSGLPLDSVLPPRSAGSYYLPVNYETSCQACHPIQATVSPKSGLPMTITVPHRLDAGVADKQLRLAVLNELTKQNKPADKAKENRGRLDPIQEGRELLKTLDEEIDTLTDAAKKQLLLKSPDGLYGMTCAKCHEMQPQQAQPFAIKSPGTPAIWYPHAKFNHSAHRAMQCASCHAEKYDEVKSASDLQAKLAKSESVAIPGLDNCRQCHAAPRRDAGGKEMIGGVRHGCVDCHRYHNGDASLQGPGSTGRDPPDGWRLGVNEFLHGSTRKSP